MSLLVIGTVGIDNIITPYAEQNDLLGGSSVYFSVAASFFTDVNILGVIGKDFPVKYLTLLREKGVDTSCIEIKDGLTFRWSGEYYQDFGDPRTLDTKLNVSEGYEPEIPKKLCKTPFVFFANNDPEQQTRVRDSVRPKLAAADTMDYWIREKRDALKQFLKKVDLLIINENEVRLLGEDRLLSIASEKVLGMGPEILIIKRGVTGVLMVTRDEKFIAPAFPFINVVDPTGAGDSFAGAFMGYLTRKNSTDPHFIKKGIIYGIVVSSYSIEDFSVNRLVDIDADDIVERRDEYFKYTHIDLIR